MSIKDIKTILFAEKISILMSRRLESDGFTTVDYTMNNSKFDSINFNLLVDLLESKNIEIIAVGRNTEGIITTLHFLKVKRSMER